MIVIPAVLHVDALRLWSFPPAVQEFMRARVLNWIAGGQMDVLVARPEKSGD